MSNNAQHVSGGGLHYVPNYTGVDTRLFRAGLKQDPIHEFRLLKGRTINPVDLHDKLSYERGHIVHSRSTSNQYFNFHYMFGGFRKYVVNRWFLNHYYRRNIRMVWLPIVLMYAYGCYGMRQYDNAAYNFFYFSD